MKAKQLALAAVCAAAVSAVSGCMNLPAGYVTSNIPVSQGQYTVVAESVSGSDHQVSAFGFGASKLGSAQDRAVRNALAQAPGADALIGMSIDIERKSLVFASIITTRVTGTAVKLK